MTSDSSFGLSEIGQISVTVHDLERATDFYRDRLGMKFLFSAPNLAFFDCGGVRLYLGKPEDPEFRSSPLIYYRVDSIHDAFEALEGRGIEFEGEPHVVHKTEEMELWMVGFRDSEGNQVVLMSEVAT